MTYNRKQEDRRRKRRGPPPEILRKGHGHRTQHELTEKEEIEQQLEEMDQAIKEEQKE